MKYRLKYSPDASDKLRKLNKKISDSNGKQVALLGISTPYRFLHLEHNYAFYRIENDTVYVTDIYSERENFMREMFRVNLRTQDRIDFWGE